MPVFGRFAATLLLVLGIAGVLAIHDLRHATHDLPDLIFINDAVVEPVGDMLR